MKDPRLGEHDGSEELPFDGKRMFWGGFKLPGRRLGGSEEVIPAEAGIQ
jgi:hypothetical protein